MNYKSKIKLGIICAVLIIVSTLTSCGGGGTSGTGVTETRDVDGIIIGENGQPIKDAKVVIQGSGAETTTDDSGKFSLPVSSNQENFVIEVQTFNTSDEFSILPAEDLEAPISISFEIIEGEVGILSLANSSIPPSPNTSELVKDPCSPNGPTCTNGKYCDYIDLSCGKNSNDSEAFGVCREVSEICTQEFAPVCGCDGKTYSNYCAAQSNAISVAKMGEC